MIMNQSNKRQNNKVKFIIVIIIFSVLCITLLHFFSFEYKLFIENVTGEDLKVSISLEKEILLDTFIEKNNNITLKDKLYVKGGIRKLRIEINQKTSEHNIFIFKSNIGYIHCRRNIENDSLKYDFLNNWFGMNYSPSPRPFILENDSLLKE